MVYVYGLGFWHFIQPNSSWAWKKSACRKHQPCAMVKALVPWTGDGQMVINTRGCQIWNRWPHPTVYWPLNLDDHCLWNDWIFFFWGYSNPRQIANFCSLELMCGDFHHVWIEPYIFFWDCRLLLRSWPWKNGIRKGNVLCMWGTNKATRHKRKVGWTN